MRRTKRKSLAYRDEFFAGRLGIRGRVLLDLAFLVGLIISLAWIGQMAMLFSLYRADRSGQVKRAAATISRNVDREDLEGLAERIGADNDLCLLLADEEGNPILSVDRMRSCVLHRMDGAELRNLMAGAPEDGSGKVSMVRTSAERDGEDDPEGFSGEAPVNRSRNGLSMLYVQKVSFADGRKGTLVLNAMITPSASVMDTLRKQFFLIAAVVVVAAGVFGTVMASGISSPLIETNRAARELSRGRYTRPPHCGGYREIAELNDTLVQAAADLSNVENLERELIANISHDLRTPLTMIQGYAETMRDLPGEMNPENMQVIIDETNRLSSLVSEILDFSRLRTGTLELNVAAFDLTEAVAAICDRVSAMTAAEGYVILRETAGPCLVEADRSRIEQVIYNLLGNALTYTGADRTVKVAEEIRGDRVRVSVSDSGKGIDAAELPYIWDRYFRARESHKRAVIGSGLGLNICRGILEKHHAPYGVDSETGKGSTFWFELPAGRIPPEGEKTAEPEASGGEPETKFSC